MQRLDGRPALGARVFIQGVPPTVVNTAGDTVRAGLDPVKVDITGKFSVTLPSDATTGNSTSIGFRVTTQYRNGAPGVGPVEFYARPIGSTVDLADITPAGGVPESLGQTAANVAAAQAAADRAEAAAAAAASGGSGVRTVTYVVSPRAGEGDYVAAGSNAQTVINQALNDLVTAAGTTPGRSGQLLLREGAYACNGSIVLPDAPNVVMVGAGKDKTVLTFSHDGPWVTKAAATKRFKYAIRDLTLSAPSGTDPRTTGHLNTIGLDLLGLSNSNFERLSIQGANIAIRMVGRCYFDRFFDVDVEEAVYGTVMSSDGTDAPNENTFAGVKNLTGGVLGCDYPVQINAGNDNHWWSCSFEDFLTGIYINDGGNTFTNVRAESNGRTGTVVHVQIGTNGKNNSFVNPYFAGTGWVSQTANVVDQGAGNSFLVFSTYKDQWFKAERNLTSAGDMVTMKRSGSGDLKAVYTADDTYANSGNPISFLARQVRASATAKYFSGLLSTVEKFFVTTSGDIYQAGTHRLDNATAPATPTAGAVIYANGNKLYRKYTDGSVTEIGATRDTVFLPNLTAAQITALGTPTGGGVLYVDAGALRYVGTSGTVTTVAPA